MLIKFRKYLLFTLIFISAFQYSYWGVFEPVYGYLRLMIITITIMLFATIDIRRIIKYVRSYKLIKINIFLILGIYLFVLIYYGVGLAVSFGPIRDILIANIMLLIGMSFKFSNKELKNLFFLYSILYFLALSSIIFLVGSGLEVLDLYLPIPKNQLGPGYAMGALISFYGILHDKTRVKRYLLLLISYIVLLLILRSRTALLALIGVLLLILFLDFKKHRKAQFIIVLLSAILLVLGFNFITDSLFRNIDTTSIDGVTSGRMDRNLMGIEFIRENLMFGETTAGSYGGGVIHNYMLKNLVAYGLIIAFPVLIIYFNILSISLKTIFAKHGGYIKIGVYMVLYLYIISLAEYSFPYSPASATFFAFFVLGIFIHSKNDSPHLK